jgi:acetyltransferase-like isoleucine patch superfamily enzyme
VTTVDEDKLLSKLREADLESYDLLTRLRKLWLHAERSIHDLWNRSLPFGDVVVNRWERATSLGFGKGTSIYDTAIVYGDVIVGENTWIGPGVILDGCGGLSIGSYCSISAGVQIYTHDTVRWAVSGGAHPPDRAPTRIGSRCYLGPNAIVSKGVTIGDGCIIGANSFVNADIPPGSRAFGTPCRIVGPAALHP